MGFPDPREFAREVQEMDLLTLVTRLTLIYLLFKPAYAWYLQAPLLILASCGLLSRSVGRSPALWLALTLLTGWKLVTGWAWVDNHLYLLSYWCLALFCSVVSTDSRRTLALNGRLLIGLAFGFAVLWKALLSADFLNGTLFRDLLLTDPRFFTFSRLVGGLSQAAGDHNTQVLTQLMRGGAETGTLEEPARLVVLAHLTTWWTLIIEVAIVVGFLALPGWRVARLRHATLLVFCWTTYAVGTVSGFGWLLVILGLAQCDAPWKRTRLLYLGTFFLILIYARVPWGALLLGAWP